MKEKMKRIPMFILLMLVYGLLSANIVFADSYSIVVSCTVPQIPGVNAPALLEKETLEPNRKGSLEETQEAMQADTQPRLDNILEEKNLEANTPQESSSLRLVKTIYSR